MYGMYPMMGMMPGMYGLYGMPGNAHQNFKNKYGVGPADFANGPYPQTYNMAVIQKEPDLNIRKTRLGRFLNKLFR